MAGLRRGTRIVVTGRVLAAIALLTFMLGSLLLYLPRVHRALWRSASLQARLLAAAAGLAVLTADHLPARRRAAGPATGNPTRPLTRQAMTITTCPVRASGH